MALSPLDLALSTWRDLTGNWVRSGLTALGIFMGVTSVSTTLNIDRITATVIQNKLDTRDRPFLSPYVYSEVADISLTANDIADLQQAVAGISSVSKMTALWANTVQYQQETVSPDRTRSVSANYQITTGRNIVHGRFFSAKDFDNYHPVAIIDEVMAEQLFDDSDPLGKSIFVDGFRLTVIGVSETKSLGSWDNEPGGELWVPATYGTVMAGSTGAWERFQIALTTLDDYETTRQAVEAHIKQLYPAANVWIWSNAGDLYKEEQQQRASARILQSLGLMALVIGGVGIANITVASIMERTREIGLRRAIGATDTEIMAQFIAEAAVLSVIGGIVGVATVHGLTTVVVTTVFPEAPYRFSWQDAALSMGSAFAIGVGASALPALRITRIDVVQALRGE